MITLCCSDIQVEHKSLKFLSGLLKMFYKYKVKGNVQQIG